MTPRRWAFIANKPFLPPGDDPFAAGLGGTEQAIIHLTEALAALGDNVTITGGSTTPRTLRGVSWQPTPPPADITVAVNDARLLPAGAKRPAIWFHNEVALTKELRRGRAPALWRHRPTAIFIGTDQARAASALLPFRSRIVIPYGLSANILRAPTNRPTPPQTAIFTSQAYRGLEQILATWQRDIAPALPGATLTALIAETDLSRYRALATHASITIAPRIANDAVLARLLQTRVLLAPGHLSETFCLAAAEAIALGVPVVTLGIGSLKERVRDNVDGFICRDYATLAARTRDLLADDALWRRMHDAGISTRQGKSWQDVARAWQTNFT